jgi:hypothetical protein
MHPDPISTELALRAFEADAAFSTALATLQEQVAHDRAGIPAGLALANQHGFSWLFRPTGDGLTEAVLRHSGGAEEKALGDDPAGLILGLLGLSALQRIQASEPEEFMQETHKAAEVQPQSGTGSLVLEAAQSLAAATGGAVVEEEEPAEAAPGRAQDDPLTDDEKAAAVAMIKAMDGPQRKAFSIAFRHGFEVPATEKAIAPLIQQFRHLQFVDRFTGEAAGVVVP